MGLRAFRDTVVERQRTGEEEWDIQRDGRVFIRPELANTRKARQGWKHDFVVRTPEWVVELPDWAVVLKEAQELSDTDGPHLLQNAVVRMFSSHESADPVSVPEGYESDVWYRFLILAQAMCAQEELNYPRANGWWTPFHLLRCVWRGAGLGTVQRAAAASTRQRRPVIAEDCGACNRCADGQRPWAAPRPQLRSYYSRADMLAPVFRTELIPS